MFRSGNLIPISFAKQKRNASLRGLLGNSRGGVITENGESQQLEYGGVACPSRSESLSVSSHIVQIESISSCVGSLNVRSIEIKRTG